MTASTSSRPRRFPLRLHTGARSGVYVGVDAAQFDQEVQLAADLYFGQVLPAFIDRYFKGGGRAFLWRLLDAHDRRTLAAIDGHVPGKRAKKRAKAVREQAPLEIAETSPLLPGGAQLLGYFSHSDMFVRETVFASRLVSSFKTVTVFPRSFFAMGWSDAQLREEIFWTIFHEYIHYFESFLLQREQVLRGREEADARVRALSLERSERLDRRAAIARGIRWTLGVAVLAACLAVPLLLTGHAL